MNLKIWVILVLLTSVLFIAACGNDGARNAPYQPAAPSGGGCGVNLPDSGFKVSSLISNFNCDNS